MGGFLKRLKPPYFEDSEQRRIAQFSHAVLLTLFAILTVIELIFIIQTRRLAIITVAIGFLILLAAFFLNLRGQTRVAAYLIVITLLVVVTTLLDLGNGIHDTSVMFLPVVLILAALLLSARGFLVMTLLSAIALGVIIYREVIGLQGSPLSQWTDYVDAVVIVATLVLTAVALRIMADFLNRSISRAEQNEKALAESNRQLQMQAEERAQRIRRAQQQQALVDIAAAEAVISGDLEQAFRAITEAVSYTLDVERASVWMIDEPRKLMRCRDLYLKSAGQHSADLNLIVRSDPTYIQIMEKDRALVASYAQADERLKELAQDYLLPMGITSILDVGIRQRGELVGVIVAEHIGPARTWVEDEVAFVTAMADQANLASLNRQRNLAEEAARRLNSELEERVRIRTQELENKARVLETFAYSVSHDLKAPLRGIDGYSRLLLEEYSGIIDEEGQRFLTTIRSATEHMNQLINDLLAYSRLERRSDVTRCVDLRELVDTILEAKHLEIEQRDVQVEVDLSVEKVNAEYEGLSQALNSLVENALKFTRDVPNPRIEIGCQLDQGRCRLWVRDNGIGFDMKYHDRIFEIFQRLHRAEEYPGTGIGLALASKAMLRIGGRVYAQSWPGEGATFYLEFPDAAPVDGEIYQDTV